LVRRKHHFDPLRDALSFTADTTSELYVPLH
jgi:hypothetical protein